MLPEQFYKFKLIMCGISGSNLYGTNTEYSDEDIRGVFIPTKEYFLGFSKRIEQIEVSGNDEVYYDIRKFFKLCLECNPNIVELLFVPENKLLNFTKEWYHILQYKEHIISKKARYTFAGYAISQLKRIERHRSWLLNPPKKQPMREDFGLPNDKKLVTKEQLNAFKELESMGKEMELDIHTMQVLEREKAFQNANAEWGEYINWKTNRNPERAILEEKFRYDTKHASHLYRLITEGKELLLTGHITFPRPDVDILIQIRNGDITYEYLVNEMVGNFEESFDLWYNNSTLRNKPDNDIVDKLCIELVKNTTN